MPTSNNNLSRFSRSFWLTLSMFVVFTGSFVAYAWTEDQVDRANESRERSFLLADELRQSSDVLTRMVRTYVVTGDPIYKQHYQEILDIRDGKKPRPASYQDIYWDLVLADDQRPRPLESAVPLMELMRRAGFTDEEFAELARAKANSDVLTRAEFAAMKLIETASPSTEADRDTAISMLHDAAYHAAKAGIMLPISRFYGIADQRTLEAVQVAKAHATRMRAAFVMFGAFLVFLLWSARRNLHAILGGSVKELHARIAHLGSGHFSSVITVAVGMENSVLGWLSETQINLARINAQRIEAEKRVQARTHDLQMAQGALITAAREAGMAEVANNVLHNVGNVLNSVNVSAAIISAKVRGSKSRGLAKAAAMLNDHAADLGSFLRVDQKGRHLPAYLNALVVGLAAEQQAITDELKSLTKSVDHIKDIVTAQQAFAGASSIVDAVQVTDLLEDALRISASATARHQVTIVKEFDTSMPPLLLDKRRLLQILVNLISNAKQATASILDRPRRMTLRASAPKVNGRHNLVICVIDEGEGIAAANLSRIFTHGFTTRKDGHGFGLHSCAVAAKEMGGILTVHSGGPGTGATFTLALSLDVPA